MRWSAKIRQRTICSAVFASQSLSRQQRHVVRRANRKKARLIARPPRPRRDSRTPLARYSTAAAETRRGLRWLVSPRGHRRASACINVLAGAVTGVHADPAFEHVMVQLAVGEVRLLAEVTRDAVTMLGISAGTPIHALIKSVSIDVLNHRTIQGDVNGR